ncbi:MAG: hypothetical protein WCG25_02475 [bacterium]
MINIPIKNISMPAIPLIRYAIQPSVIVCHKIINVPSKLSSIDNPKCT